MASDPKAVMPSNIKVVVRVRPLNERELQANPTDDTSSGILQIRNNNEDDGEIPALDFGIDDVVEGKVEGTCSKGSTISISDRAYSSQATPGKKRKPRSFVYDAVFGQQSTQEQIYGSVKGIVDAVCAGYNGTVVAYGQTGSGKTHTIFGGEMNNHAKAGLFQRSLGAIFDKLRLSLNAKDNEDMSIHSTTTTNASFFEIYNERVYDLLSMDTGSDEKGLALRGTNEVSIEGLTEVQVESAADTMGVLYDGTKNRSVASTKMNRASSRSHAIFVLSIKQEYVTKDGASKVCKSRFTLVDLAGSERQKSTDAAGVRLKEANAINKSLTCLGQVINALVDRQSGKNPHIPFRDTKLTRILQDSLGGNSKTCIVATVTPSISSLKETLSTLEFAQRAKLIQNSAVRNNDAPLESIEALQAENVRLKAEIARLRSVGSSVSETGATSPIVPRKLSSFQTPVKNGSLSTIRKKSICWSQKLRRTGESMDIKGPSSVKSAKRKHHHEETKTLQHKERGMKSPLSARKSLASSHKDCQIKSLAKEKSMMAATKEEMEKVIEQQSHSIEVLSRKLDSLRSERDGLLTQSRNLCRLHNEMAELEDEIEYLTWEKENMEERLNFEEADNERTVRLQEHLSNEHAVILDTHIATYDELIGSMAKKATKLHDELIAKSAEHKLAREACDELFDQTLDLKEELDHCSNQRSESQQEEARKVNDLQCMVEQLRREYNLVKRESGALKEAKTSLESELYRAKINEENMRATIKDHEAQQLVESCKINDLKLMSEQLKNENSTMKCNFAEAVESKTSLESELGIMKGKLKDHETMRVADSRKNNDLVGFIDQLKKQISHVKRQAAAMEDANVSLESTIRTMKSSRETMKVRVKELERENELLRNSTHHCHGANSAQSRNEPTVAYAENRPTIMTPKNKASNSTRTPLGNSTLHNIQSTGQQLHGGKIGKIAHIEKGDRVRVQSSIIDCFGDERDEWFYGVVLGTKKASESMVLRIKYDDTNVRELPYPNDEFQLEKLEPSNATGDSNLQLNIGDAVDCQFQDDEFKQGWSRGWVADINDSGNSCNIIYYDNCYESYVPTNKVRLIQRCDSSDHWMTGKSVSLLDPSRKGTVIAVQREQESCRVVFSDGSIDLVKFEEAAKGVFRYLWKDCPSKKRFVWPGANITMAERAKLRRRTRNDYRAIQSHASPQPELSKSRLASKKITKVKVTVNGELHSAKTCDAMLPSKSKESRAKKKARSTR